MVKRKTEKLSLNAEERSRLERKRAYYDREKLRPGDERLEGPIAIEEYVALHRAFPHLKKLREQAGLSLSDVAERSGMDRAEISRLENGIHANPTIGTLSRYAEALGKEIVVSFVEST
jgi:DNA-binding XRE family transcriptional regulator